MRNFRESTGYQSPTDDEMRARARSFAERVSSRRSIRHFDPRPVPLEVLRDCVRAAASAPSGANQQPWHFAVVTDPEVKQAIRVAAEAEEKVFYETRAPNEWLNALAPLKTNSDKSFLENTGALIAIFVERWHTTPDGANEKRYYPRESVGIATGLLITAVHHAGLVCLTYTPSPMNFLREMLGRPEGEVPFLVLAVGHPAPDAQIPDIERKPLSDVMSVFAGPESED